MRKKVLSCLMAMLLAVACSFVAFAEEADNALEVSPAAVEDEVQVYSSEAETVLPEEREDTSEEELSEPSADELQDSAKEASGDRMITWVGFAEDYGLPSLGDDVFLHVNSNCKLDTSQEYPVLYYNEVAATSAPVQARLINGISRYDNEDYEYIFQLPKINREKAWSDKWCFWDGNSYYIEPIEFTVRFYGNDLVYEEDTLYYGDFSYMVRWVYYDVVKKKLMLRLNENLKIPDGTEASLWAYKEDKSLKGVGKVNNHWLSVGLTDTSTGDEFILNYEPFLEWLEISIFLNYEEYGEMYWEGNVWALDSSIKPNREKKPTGAFPRNGIPYMTLYRDYDLNYPGADYSETAAYANGITFWDEVAYPVTVDFVEVGTLKKTKSITIRANQVSGYKEYDGYNLTDADLAGLDPTVCYALFASDQKGEIGGRDDMTFGFFLGGKGGSSGDSEAEDYTEPEQTAVSVSGVRLSHSLLSLKVGDQETLMATVNPENAADHSVTYSVEGEAVSFEVKDNRLLLTGTAPGTAVITVSSNADTGKTAVCKVIVSAADYGDEIPERVDGELLQIVGLDEEIFYTGGKLSPAIKVYDGTTLLKEKIDYTAAFSNNINAAETTASKPPTVTITGKGLYTGKLIKKFTIRPVNLTENPEGFVAAATSAAPGKEGLVTATFNGKKLSANDFRVLPKEEDSGKITVNGLKVKASQTGTYELIIEGKGNFTGKTNVLFTAVSGNSANEIPAAKVSITLKGNLPYSENGAILSSEQLKITYGKNKQELPVKYDPADSSDGPFAFSVSYLNNENAGKATAIIRGTEQEVEIGGTRLKFYGEVRKTFGITGTPLSKAEIVKLPKSLPYSGEAYDSLEKLGGAAVRIKNAQETLTEGKDYSILFSNCTDAGTATILLTGKGAYTGTLKKTFKITPYDMGTDASGKLSINASDTVFAKGGAEPEVIVLFGDKLLRQGADYSVKYADNKKPGNGKVIVTGKGNFTKSATKSFTIAQKELGSVTVAASDVKYNAKTQKGSYYQAKIAVYDTDHKLLAANKDYVVSYSLEKNKKYSSISAGTRIYYTIDPGSSGFYTGSQTGYYTVQETVKDISKAKAAKIANKSYTGSEIELTEEDKAGLIKLDAALKEGTDFEIVSYFDNVVKGKASVLLKAKGGSGYSGSKLLTFNIGNASINTSTQ